MTRTILIAKPIKPRRIKTKMIKTITYNPRAKNITLETDSSTYPTYVCYTLQTLCQALDKFAPQTAEELKAKPITLTEFISKYAQNQLEN